MGVPARGTSTSPVRYYASREPGPLWAMSTTTTVPKETSIKKHPASSTLLIPTIAGRTSQAATRAAKNATSAPAIANATSDNSSEASTADPGANPSRPWTPPFPQASLREVKHPLEVRLRASRYRPRAYVPEYPALPPRDHAKYPDPDSLPSPKARTRDPTPTSSPLYLLFVFPILSISLM